MIPATGNSGKERFVPVMQLNRQLARMNSVQKKTQTIFFVNTNSNRKSINRGGDEPEWSC
jgi:hypothetical protein